MVDREREFYAYQEYLAQKRADNAPAFGATALLSTIALGVVDSPRPRMEMKERVNVHESTSREIANIAILRTMHEEEPVYDNAHLSTGYAAA